jgi:hypothetical protein
MRIEQLEMTLKELFQVASLSGYVRIAPGLSLSSQKSLQEEQKIWAHDEPNKFLDLNSHPFWIATDDRQSLHGVSDEKDLGQVLMLDPERTLEAQSDSMRTAFLLLF